MPFLLALLLLLKPISIRVTPANCFAPCTVHVTTTIRPDAENRWYIVQIDGEMFSSSAHPVAGEDEPPQHDTEFKELPEGDYEVLAVLYRADPKHSEVARVSATVSVR